MGITLIAIGNHDLEPTANDIHNFCGEIEDRLKMVSPNVGMVVDWKIVEDTESTSQGEWNSTGEVHFVLSRIPLSHESHFVINLYMGEKCYSLFTGVSWKSFFEFKDVENRISMVIGNLARIMGSTSIVYLPDSGICSGFDGLVSLGYSFEEILHDMRVKCGEPAKSTQEVITMQNITAVYDRYILSNLN